SRSTVWSVRMAVMMSRALVFSPEARNGGRLVGISCMFSPCAEGSVIGALWHGRESALAGSEVAGQAVFWGRPLGGTGTPLERSGGSITVPFEKATGRS